MARLFLMITLVFSIALSSACASKKPRPEPVIYFSTNITTDGGKFFVYRLEMPERSEQVERGHGARGRKGGGRPEQAGQGRGAAKAERNKDLLKQRVDTLIAKNRFCRDGYFVLDQYTGAGGASLRGECREGATEEDRTRFPNAT